VSLEEHLQPGDTSVLHTSGLSSAAVLDGWLGPAEALLVTAPEPGAVSLCAIALGLGAMRAPFRRRRRKR